MKPSEPTRWWDLPAALLLLLALISLAGCLIKTEWVDHLRLVRILIFLGGVTGLALGQSRFSPRQVAVFALAYGFFLLPWQLGRTVFPSIEHISESGLWVDRLVSLNGRLINAIDQLARREAVQDPIFFLFCMAALFWVLGTHAGYTLTRYAAPWRIILPAGLTLLIIHAADFYATSRTWYLVSYVFFSLLLLARLTFLRRRAHWQRIQANFPSLIILDFVHLIFLAAVLLVSLAWTIPALANALPVAREAWQQTIHPWWTAAHERLDDAFASLRRPTLTSITAGYYGDSLSLGRGSELTDDLSLTVQAPSRSGGLPYYWRARVYDHYADGRWSNVALSTTHSVSSSDWVSTFPELEGRREVTFTFTSVSHLATLYTASRPRWVSLPAHADMVDNSDGTVDLFALHAAPPLRPGEAYRVHSSISDVTVVQLRTAGVDYPRWVAERYLQVPATVTTRTLELARRIAADQENPYDTAIAVTKYLRTHIQYKEVISSLPADRELLDWFLFDLQEGFCNYYASAEVILLRLLGVPARLAVGFAQGERQPGSNIYLVRRKNAHTWVEVYFPKFGWIEFEPTASQSPLVRPSGESQPDIAAGPASPGDIEGQRERLEELLAREGESLEPETKIIPSFRLGSIFWILLLVLGLIALVWYRRRRRGLLPSLPVLLETGLLRFNLQPPAILRRWLRRVTLSPLMRAYQKLNQALVRLGAAPVPSDTPAERAAALSALIPAAEDPARRLMAEYQDAIYGPRSGNLHIARESARAVRNLSWKAKVRQLIFGWREENSEKS